MQRQTQPQQYQIPSLEELRQGITQLRATYVQQKKEKNETPNSIHLESITLIERCAAQIFSSNYPEQNKIIVGLLLFPLLKNEHKWGMFSAVLPTDKGVFTQLLKKLLGLSNNNTMSQQERLVFLHHFYGFAFTQLSDNWVADLHYKNKKGFMQSFDIKIKQTLNLQTDYVAYVLKKESDYESLEKNLDKACIDYDAIFKSRWRNRFSWTKNTKKEADLHYVQTMQQSCKDRMSRTLLQVMSCSQEERNRIMTQEKKYLNDIRKALILSIAVPLEQNSYLSPEGTLLNHGSELCMKLLAAANITLDSVTHTRRIELLQLLMGFLNQEHIKDVDVKKVCDAISMMITYEEVAKTVPTFSEKYTGLAIGYLATYGINLLITHLATDVIAPNIGGMIVGGIAGPLGIVSYGVAGVVIQTQLGKYVQEKVIDAATAAAYECVLAAIGDYIGQFIAPNLIMTFEISATGLAKLLGFYHDLKKFDESFAMKIEWLKAMHELPNHLVNNKTKQILEKTHAAALSC